MLRGGTKKPLRRNNRRVGMDGTSTTSEMSGTSKSLEKSRSKATETLVAPLARFLIVS